MIGTTISNYKIIEKIGAGGMGEVFLAEDGKLDRKVALKFLPPGLASDPDVKARFMQEAKAASALNHPNVCTIHDIQDHDGQMYIVMEFVDGATLADKKSQLSVKKAVDIVAQIADGLAAAHEKGIVHRDIKSENIMLRTDGIAQVMDFGLAKLRGMSRLTKEGSTVGTTAYMSPEALQGQDLDYRTDLYSLGVVLFELLTGRLPFDAVHETAVMYEIVNVDAPPPTALRADLDPELDRIVLECLDKDPDERYQSAKGLAKDLRRFNRTSSGRKAASRVSTIKPVHQQASTAGKTQYQSSVKQGQMQPAAQPPLISPAKPSKLPWILAGVLAFAFIGLLAQSMGWINVSYTSGPTVQHITRSHILIPNGGLLSSLGGGHIAISPDGKKLAYAASDSSSNEILLRVRDISALTEIKLPGTRDASYPFWSPDSKYIGFFTDGKLKKIQATGGPALTICDAVSGRLGSWSVDNTIVFSPHWARNLMRVVAAGGTPEELTTKDTVAGDHTHRWPWFLPDGKHYLYFARTTGGTGSEHDAICVRSLDGSVYKRLIPTASNVAYAAGHILFMRSSTLMARPFDLNSLDFSGDAFPIAENVSFNSQFSKGSFSVSENGILIYQSGEFVEGSLLLTYDREGRVLDTIGEPTSYYDFELSPDESRLLVDIQDLTSSKWDTWSHDLRRGIRTRLTFGQEDNGNAIMSPDGERFAFMSQRRDPAWDMYIKSADGVGEVSPLLISPHETYPLQWSADGRYILYSQVDSGGSIEHLWALPMDDVENPIQLTRGEFEASEGRISPDGRWIVYMSIESGSEQVYVAAFPGMQSKWQVSINEGDRPYWRKDGKELFFFSNADEIMAAEVDGSGRSFQIGRVARLFETTPQRPGNLYQPYADGQRFIVNTNIAPADISTAVMVVNWHLELPEE